MPYLGNLVIVSVALLFVSCRESNQVPPRDAVVTPGTSFLITNPNGNILIEWDGPHGRRFTYEDMNWREPMTAREELWYGVLGIGSAGDTNFSRKGDVRRIVYQEASRDFDSEEALAEYMDVAWNKNSMKLVWNNSGFVGGLCGTPERKQLNVDFWLFTVGGHVPELFAGKACREGGISIMADE